MTNKFKVQTGQEWLDQNNRPVEKKRITPREVTAEKASVKIANLALLISDKLLELKRLCVEESQKYIAQFEKEQGGQYKGERAVTFYSFDRSIKVVHEVQQMVEYDESTMQMAHERFVEFIENVLPEGGKSFLKLVSDAFKSTKGRFDNRKIAILVSYKEDPDFNKHEEFMKAIELIEKARKEVGKRNYERVFIRNEKGEYEPIELQFSSIQLGENTKDQDWKLQM